MKHLLIIAIILFSLTSFAQDTTKHATKKPVPEVTAELMPFQKDPFIPEFSILLADSTHFTNKNIQKGRPTVIVYFSPECSHCQADAKNLMEKLDSLKDINFVWSSSHEADKLAAFAIKYNMDKQTNMVFGKDEKWAIPSFFKITFTPYFAVYDKDGVFFTEFRNGLLPKDLIKAVEDSNKPKEVKKKKK